MDTKSKSIKPALAFLAFVVGISLLIYSGVAWTYLSINISPATRASVMDVFQSDYQQTSTFRSQIGGNLYSLLNYAIYAEDGYVGLLNEEDTNLLYRVEKNGQQLTANTEAALNGPDTLPEG